LCRQATKASFVRSERYPTNKSAKIPAIVFNTKLVNNSATKTRRREEAQRKLQGLRVALCPGALVAWKKFSNNFKS